MRFIRGLGGIAGSRRMDAAVRFHPEGITAISRGLSEATPPVRSHREGICILKGCWQVPDASPIEPGWHPFRMQIILSELFRGCRFAQPPDEVGQMAVAS